MIIMITKNIKNCNKNNNKKNKNKKEKETGNRKMEKEKSMYGGKCHYVHVVQCVCASLLFFYVRV